MNPQVLGDFTFWPITFLASFLIWVMFAALLALWVVDGRIKKKQVAQALLATLFAFFISQLIKNLFPTLRPFVVYDLIPRTLTTKNDAAFPSSHTAAAFGLATSIWPYARRVGIGFVVAAILVGIGRVLGNVHYFWDIVGGAVIGVVVAVSIDKIHFSEVFTNFKKK